jgi:hypothetical protein
MFRLFAGPARILGVRDGWRNCKGFDGAAGTVERGTPGRMPSVARGRDVEISSFDAELRNALHPYGVTPADLPVRVVDALMARKAFTLAEGEQPVGLYKGRIDAEDLVGRVIRHEQSTLCLEQMDVFVVHNGRLLNGGKKLVLSPIAPYPELESPFIYEIPELLPLDNGETVSTTDGGSKEKGRLILHTSAENMQTAYKNLRPRWQIIYRTKHQMIGAKSVAELVSAAAGAAFIYGTVELAALEPTYVEHGRRRPKNGPLVEAIDQFVAEKIRELARVINSLRKQELDDRALDEVHRENRKLDEFKNQFLPSLGEGDGGDQTGPGRGPVIVIRPEPPQEQHGTVSESLDYQMPLGGFHIGKEVEVNLRAALGLTVRDANGRHLHRDFEWFTDDAQVAVISEDGVLEAREKGVCEVWARVKSTEIETERIPILVWNIDHVLLTPRQIDIALGKRQQITAEVTNDEGQRSTEVLLNWKHDAEDALMLRVSNMGVVTANRLGRAAVTAGAGSVWARIPVEVHVMPSPEKNQRGRGFPQLLLTGRDTDPATGLIRDGDPDQPALWQETSDFVRNIWWLNLQSPEAAFAFRQRAANPEQWRAFHAEKLIEMVVEVWMSQEYTTRGENERPEFWSAHLSALARHRVRITQQMWARLERYASTGESLDQRQATKAAA